MTAFEKTGLSKEVIKAITALGFENPTPIQEKTIPMLLSSSKDLIALAQTGTGKTAAFGLPLIQKTDTTLKKVQTLVLCPTRELCLQVASDIKSYSRFMEGFKIAAVYGGANISNQINALKDGTQVVIGTPGRTLDLINRKKLDLSNISMLILDEADEMLSMGFKEDLNAILADTPSDKQTLLFSATMSKEIKNITKKYMKNPEEITIGNKNSGAENVTHHYYIVQHKDKYEALRRIADINPDVYGIVFCRTKYEAKQTAEKLIRDGYNADALHGDLSQPQRDQVMKKFRMRQLQLLVATDVAARGLDVTDLTHVINLELPDELGVYTHRTGRTGRAGKNGTAVSLLSKSELRHIRVLERTTGKKFELKDVPLKKDICEKQLNHFVEKVKNSGIDIDKIEDFLPAIYDQFDSMSKEEIIQHFVSIEFNRFLSYYKNANDIKAVNAKPKKEINSRKNISFVKYKINLGSDKKTSPMDIIELINKRLGRRKIEIGKIDILKKYSYVEIDSRYEKEFVRAFLLGDETGKTFKIAKADNSSRLMPAKPSHKAKVKRTGKNQGKTQRSKAVSDFYKQGNNFVNI